MTYEADFDFRSLPIHVEYTYSPAEKGSWNYPGCEEEHDICVVTHAGELINDFIDDMDLWDELINELIEHLKDRV